MSNHPRPRNGLHVVPPEGEKLSEDGIPLTAEDASNIERLQALQAQGVPVQQFIDLRGTYLVALLEEIAGYDGIVNARAKHASAVADQLDALESNLRQSVLTQGVLHP